MSRRGIVVFNIMTMLLILILFEGVYRIHLWRSSRQSFSPPEDGLPNFPVFEKSFYRYDEEEGYSYAPGVVYATFLSAGRITDVQPVGYFSSDGLSGTTFTDWDGASIRGMMFGDSMVAISDLKDGVYWTIANVLERRLQNALGKKVCIQNMGQDGTGVLQIFGRAARRTSMKRPDFFVIAFITQDLSRERIWRTVAEVDGELRALVTYSPNPLPSLRESAELLIANPKASPENITKALSNDSLRSQLEHEFCAQYRRYAMVIARPSIFSVRSFLFYRLWRGDPLFGLRTRSGINSSHYNSSFEEDARFAHDVETIQRLGIPYVIVHLALASELEKNEEYLFTGSQETLLESLEQLTAKRVYTTTGNGYVPPNPRIICREPGDEHPGYDGMVFYADVIANALKKEGLLLSATSLGH